MTSRDEELLAAIRADPDDDAPRLVYADLLTERGDPRGELIQLQLQPSEDEVRIGREQLSLARFAASWNEAAGIAAAAKVTYRRGFAMRVAGEARAILASARAFATQPITDLTVTGVSSESLAPLVPLAAALRRLRIESRHGLVAASVAPLWSVALPNLRELALVGNLLDDDHAPTLAAASWIPQLERLHLQRPSLSPHVFRALCERLVALRALDVRHCDLLPVTAEYLGASPLPLRELWLEACALGQDGARALFESPLLSQLVRLVVGNELLRDTATVLATSPHAHALRALDLFRGQLGDDDAVALAGAANLGQLRELGLAHNLIGSAGSRALAQSHALHSLATLHLTGNQLGLRGVTPFIDRAGLPALRTLGIYDTVREAPWAETQQRFAHLPSLEIV